MWNSIVVTVVAGSAVRLALVHTPAQRLWITPLIGAATAVTYVLSQDPGAAGATNKTNNNFIAELAPASATVPGSMFMLNRLSDGPPIDVQEFAVDGVHSGDLILCAWELP